MAVQPLCLFFFLLFVLDASEAAPLNDTCNGTMGTNCTEATQTPATTLDTKTDRMCVSICNYGWTAHDCRCIRVFNAKLSWINAEKICLRYNGNLASVHSYREYAFIQNLIKSQNHKFTEAWIGGNDAVSKGTWLWSDGSKMNLHIWAPGQPDNPNENCIGMNFDSTKNWNNYYCDRPMAFVCMKK
ncbi:galactose-specific lectin nattectin-like [Garra rufa]|uniref:galactose-specific lectin nattectin-like n=1 Tax=Garra rufa TaxID=137080 RepID=UPI003CCE55A5